MLLMWTENLSCGVKEFDDDHKRLIKMINHLHGAIEDAREKGELDKEEIEIVLHRLENYTKYHCGREEQYFQETGYPDLEAHKAEHQRLIDGIAEMQGRFHNSTDPKQATEIVQVIYDWLVEHIFVTDKKFCPHMHTHGIF
jgi:hemerythrin-like metal-binding protein